MSSRQPLIAASDLLSLPDAAKKIGVHFATLYRWSKPGRHGEPPKVYTTVIGGQRCIPRSEIKRLQKELKNGNREGARR